jgi:phage-related protein
MLINNIDISSFKATYLSKDIQTAEVVIYDDWLRNALNPLYLSKQETYKQIKLQLLIKDTEDESCLNDISNLVKQFEKCTIKFDDLSFYYDCLIVNKDHKRIVKGWYTLDVELKSGYAYKSSVTETMNNVASKIITVQGNLPTPVIVIITVPINTISLTLTGFRDSITINNLLANVPVIIDGESCTVLQAGVNKFMDTDMWSFPVLQSGANTIITSNSNCVITIVYKPKYI